MRQQLTPQRMISKMNENFTNIELHKELIYVDKLKLQKKRLLSY